MNLYRVVDARFENDAFPDIKEIWSRDAESAGKDWAEQKWATYGYPEEMACLVTDAETGKPQRVCIHVQARPEFYAWSEA